MQLMPALLSLLPPVARANTPQVVEDAKNLCSKDTEDIEACMHMVSGSVETGISTAVQHGDDDADADPNDDEDGLEAAVSNKPTQSQLDTFLAKLGDGVDFGVVAIFSCPNSCSASNEEFALVQPPSDIGI